MRKPTICICENKDADQLRGNRESISAEDWRSCCRHVKDINVRFWTTDIAVDDQVDRLVITVTSSDEDTDTASDSYDDERTDTASEGHEASRDFIVMSFCYFIHCESN